LDLFKQGIDLPDPERALARGRLYRHLYTVYESMQRHNLLQLHFHLADGTSYLRFHQPDLYGDALFAARPSVRICNSEQRIVQGMEIGKIRSGFRYVFPLFSDNRHLGSVEVSVTFKAILQGLNELAPNREYGFVLNRALTETHLFPEQRWLYSPSVLNDRYLVEDADAVLPNSPPPLSDTAQSLNAIVRTKPKVIEAMQSGETLNTTVNLASTPYTITILPIKDVDQRLAGYLISYAHDPFITHIHQEFIILLLYTVFALLLIFGLIWRLKQRTLALAEEQRKTSAMNDAMAEGVYVQNCKGVITRVNPAACQLLGYAEHELVGQIAHDLFHRPTNQGDCTKEECVFFRKIALGERYDGEEHFLCKNGTLLLMEVASRPILENDTVAGAVVAFHDITERKRTEAALRQSEELGRRLTTAVEQSPASVVITDAEGTIEYVNQKFIQKTGYSIEEALGQNPRLLKSGLMPEAIYKDLWATIIAGREWKGDLQNRRRDGSLFWESISISPIRDEQGIITHFISIKEDISERIRMEEDLRTANQRLEEAIIRAEQLAREAETANRSKSQFLANMSHEIRTPMSAIIGMTHLAMQTTDNAKRQRFLGTVQHAAESLLVLLNDILDFSKMEAGQLQLNLTPFSPARLLDGVLATIHMPAEEKGLPLIRQLDPGLPEWLIGDDMRLRQILLNLIGNAIKFTASGSITVHMFQEQADAANEVLLHLCVTDTGIGIPQDKLSTIFNTFEQVDNSYVRQYGGTGLGLSICRQLVTLMHGSIWVESSVPGGSAFHCRVPLQVCNNPMPLDHEGTVPPYDLPTNLRILVVDDNEVNRDVAMMILEQDHHVTTATNGMEALKALARADYDLLFMDVQMPIMDGLSATRVIRNLERGLLLEVTVPGTIEPDLRRRLAGRHLTIVAMTAHAMGGDREMCLAAGMDRYITKPFQPGQLLEVLRAVQNASDTTGAPREKPPEPLSVRRPAPTSRPTTQDVITYLQRSTLLNGAQIDRILVAIQTSLSNTLAKAEIAAADNDLATLARAGHTLKGTLLQCGLNDWSELAQFLYDAANQQQDLPYGRLLGDIRTGLSQLI
jgi:PAS domain S-box-containing protein